MTREICRPLLLSLALVFSNGALAQATTTEVIVPPAIQVERLAPQLQVFAGSPSNFTSLVTGLAQGTQVTLTSLAPDGSTEIVTFTPSGTMTATTVAQTLEAVRQQLISRGVAAPTALQIATALAGGDLQTLTGSVPLPGVLPPTVVPPVATVVTGGVLDDTSTAMTQAAGSFHVFDNGIIAPVQPRFNTSDSPSVRNTSDSPPRGLNPLPGAVVSAPLGGTPLVPSTPPSLRTLPPSGGSAPAGFAPARR